MVSMIGMVFQLTRKDGILLLKRPKDHVDHTTMQDSDADLYSTMTKVLGAGKGH